MRLTWNVAYRDYNDTENWSPRYKELTAFARQLSTQDIAVLDETALLEALEQTEELMRYYLVIKDMKALEPIMRQYNALLETCDKNGVRGVEATYFHMIFLRLNAVLYRVHDQNRKALEVSLQAVERARRVFGMLKTGTALSDEQILFVGWNSIECFKEAAEIADLVLDTDTSVHCLKDALPLLVWIEPYVKDASGICDKAADLYAQVGGVLYTHQDKKEAARCFRKAVELLRSIDADYYRAKAIWCLSVYGLLAFVHEQDTTIMLECDRDANGFLCLPGLEQRDKAIVLGAKGIITMQRSAALQAGGQLADAFEEAQEACDELKKALAMLEDYAARDSDVQAYITSVCARIYNQYIGALDCYAVICYQCEEHEKAERGFLDVLSQFSDNKRYAMGESSTAVIRAEACEYLALLATDKGDAYQADFYGTQAADAACEVAPQLGLAPAWTIAVVSCCIVAEVALKMKNKKKASLYAERGLEACEALRRLDPNNQMLGMQSMLAKFKKKADRKFF